MLPANPHDFRSAEYWKSFFLARGCTPFEWYSSLADFHLQLQAICPVRSPPPRILVPGCGNSALSEELWQAGYKDVVSLDFDAGVVSSMRAKTALACPGLQWRVASATRLPEAQYPTASFSVVLDKGLLDAMLPCSDSEGGKRDGAVYMAACARLLAPTTGALLIVTLLQDHVLEFILQHLSAASPHWQELAITAIELRGVERKGAEPAGAPSPFLLVLRRSSVPYEGDFLPLAGQQQPPVRIAGNLHALEGVPSAVRGMRWSRGLKQGLGKVTGDTYIALDLWPANLGEGPAAATTWGTGTGTGRGGSGAASGESSSARGVGSITPSGTPPLELGFSPLAMPLYTCTVVDVPSHAAAAAATSSGAADAAAVLLVPVGREHEWLFATRKGQITLGRQASVRRLILVSLGAGTENTRRFNNMTQAEVQKELSSALVTMLPSKAGGGGAAAPAVPFLAVAAELGKRLVIAQGHSPLSGMFVVEDCVDDAAAAADSEGGGAEACSVGGGGGEQGLEEEEEEEEEHAFAALALSATKCKGGGSKKKKKGELKGGPAAAAASSATSFSPQPHALRGSGGSLFNRRRLIFASNRAALQSEVHLSRRGTVTHARAPCFAYHAVMAAAIELLHHEEVPPPPPPSPPTCILLLGLGGGALPSYLSLTLPCASKLHIVAVELDASIVECAVKNFGLPIAGPPLTLPLPFTAAAAAAAEEEKAETFGGASFPPAATAAAVQALAAALTPPPSCFSSSEAAVHPPHAGNGGVHVVISDALHVLRLLTHADFPRSALPGIIIVDVNTGKEELFTGLSFPPPGFVKPSVLGDFHRALGGEQLNRQLFIMNVGARCTELTRNIVADVEVAFSSSSSSSSSSAPGAAAQGASSVHLLKPDSIVRLAEEEEEEEEESINCLLFAGPAAARVQAGALKAFVKKVIK